jgi:phosphate transport system permease protein
MKSWIRSGAPWVWLNAAAVTTSILLVVGLLLLIAGRGMVHFWPSAVHEVVYQPPDGPAVVLAGHIRDEEVEVVNRILFKTGNRDLGGADFRWLLEPAIVKRTQPVSLAVLEREEWGRFFGRVVGLKQAGELLESEDVWPAFQSMLDRADGLRGQISDLEQDEIGSVNYRMERLRLAERELELEGRADPETLADIERQREDLRAEYAGLEEQLLTLNEAIRRDAVIMQTADGREVELPLETIIDAWKPNARPLPAQGLVVRGG